MASDPRLMALPALRKRAEEEARETRAVLVDLADRYDPVPWEGTLARVHLTLLSDLSRPASRDAVARLVAERLDRHTDASFVSLYRDPQRDGAWVLEVRTCGGFTRFTFAETADGWDPDMALAFLTVLPGITSVTDPTEALTMIALKVLGGPDAPT